KPRPVGGVFSWALSWIERRSGAAPSSGDGCVGKGGERLADRFVDRPRAADCEGFAEGGISEHVARRRKNSRLPRLAARERQRLARRARRSKQSHCLIGVLARQKKQGAIFDAADRLGVHLKRLESGQRLRESPARRVAVPAGSVHPSQPPQCDSPISLVLGFLA